MQKNMLFKFHRIRFLTNWLSEHRHHGGYNCFTIHHPGADLVDDANAPALVFPPAFLLDAPPSLIGPGNLQTLPCLSLYSPMPFCWRLPLSRLGQQVPSIPHPNPFASNVLYGRQRPEFHAVATVNSSPPPG